MQGSPVVPEGQDCSLSYSVRAGYRFPYNFTRCYLRWSYWYRMLKHWYQRMRYGVSFADQWSLDSYLSRVLIRALPHYQNRNNETHVMFFLAEDQAKHFEYMNGDDNPDAQAGLDRWDAMIDEILEGIAIEGGDNYEFEYSPEGQAKIDRAWLLFGEHIRGMWD